MDSRFQIDWIAALTDGIPETVQVHAVHPATGAEINFDAVVRIDTPGEADYYRHGGIMPYVLRQLLDEEG